MLFFLSCQGTDLMLSEKEEKNKRRGAPTDMPPLYDASPPWVLHGSSRLKAHAPPRTPLSHSLRYQTPHHMQPIDDKVVLSEGKRQTTMTVQ